MRHSYEQVALPKEEYRGGYKVKSKHKCKSCGLVKEVSNCGNFYQRSNLHFDYSPGCIDWELENSKTID